MPARGRLAVPAIAAAALTLSMARPAVPQAAEQAITLPPGPGAAETSASCSACHSLDYIRMNAPFLTEEGWKAEIAKMRTAFGARLDDADSAKILAYLATNDGPLR